MLLGGVALGCSEEVTGPSPAVVTPPKTAGTPKPLPVDPGIVCNAQLTTAVVVHGRSFSPIPIDIPKHPRLALPSLTLFHMHKLDGGTADAAQILYSGDPDKPVNLDLLSWQSQEQMTFTINQGVELSGGKKGLIDSGIYDVKVTNPNTNETEEPGAIAVVDKPTFATVTPSILCVAQGDKKIDLAGTTFLQIEGTNATLSVDGVATPLSVTALTDCTDIKHPKISAKYCNKGSLTLTQGSIDAGYPALTVQNPETAACKTEESVKLRVVPPPVLTAVTPPIACVHDEDRTFTIEGTDFLQIDGQNPVVTMAGKGSDAGIVVNDVAGCEDLATEGPDVHQVKKCTQVKVTVKAGSLDPGLPEIIVTNPAQADCSVSNSVALRIVPPPTVTAVQPPLVCVDDGPRTLDVIGTDFLTIADPSAASTDPVLPAVAFDLAALDPAAVAVAAADCTAIDVQGLTVLKCTKLTVTLGANGLPAGTPKVRVTNPEPAGCFDEKPGLLTVVPGPKVTKAEPPLICAEDSDRTIVFTGTGLLKVDTDVPKVTLDGTAVTTTSLAGCSPVTVNGLTVETCTSLTATVPKGMYLAGHTEVGILNPQPAGCTATSKTILTIPPPLAFAATPQNLCMNSGTHPVTLSGTGFLKVGTDAFAVAVEGVAATAAPVSACTDLGVDGLAVEACTDFGLTVDTSKYPVGGVEVRVQNPDPSACSITSTTALQIVSPPVITKVEPIEICSDQAQKLKITGTSFANGATVTATPTGAGTGAIAATTVVVTGTTQIDATFANGLPAGTYDITVTNAASCSDTATAALLVDPTPLVVFVDPMVIFSGISVQATIITTGLTQNAKSVQLVDSAGTVTDVTAFKSPQRPNKILADIPTGLPAGQYTVRVTSQIGCVGELPGGVKITDTLTLTLDATGPIAPDYVSSTQPTAVTLKGTGFVDTPRVYLNPSSGSGTTTAIAVRAVVFGSGTQLTGVVPPGVTPGDYDLIVVNPTGEVGVATGAVHVPATEPPVITSVAPNSFPTGGGVATITGDHFDTSGVTVSLDCKPAGGGATTPFATSGVAALTATSVRVTIPGTIPAGDVCVVTLTNTSGAFFTYSAISVKNPSANLFPWAAASSNMVEARRALALVAGRPTSTSRYLYAIGGDTGAASGAKTSVEAVPTDVFGALGTWSLLPANALPAARTLAGSAIIGRFIYLVGGHDGTTGATSTTYRAQILDPLAGPDVVDLDAALGNGTTGLDQGLWYYRVSATFPSTDPSNPSGEALGGEPFPVQLPQNPKKITLTLNWSEVTSASGYKVYRTPAAGAGAGALELLTTITCGDKVCRCGVDIQCRFTDAGGATQAGKAPLPTGSLGAWHRPAGTDLGTPREGLATLAVPNPNDATESFLYAFGGRNGATFLASYEWARVKVAADGSQTVSGWTAGTRSIGGGKADTAAWVVTSKDSAAVTASQAFVFVGTGHTTATATTGEVTSGILNTSANDGDLIAAAGGTLDTENGPSGQGFAGIGYGAASGLLYSFGGEKASGLETNDSSSSVAAGPALANWNSIANGSVILRRSFAHVAQESAFFYIAGGKTGTAAATNSVERTVQ